MLSYERKLVYATFRTHEGEGRLSFRVRGVPAILSRQSSLRNLARGVGFEPTRFRLKTECSELTVELPAYGSPDGTLTHNQRF